MERNVKRWVKKAQKEMLLTHWDIKIKFVKELEDNEIAHVRCNSDYNEAYIYFSDEVLELGKKEVKRACYHEVAHIIIWHLSELAANRFIGKRELLRAVEMATEHIAKMMVRR